MVGQRQFRMMAWHRRLSIRLDTRRALDRWLWDLQRGEGPFVAVTARLVTPIAVGNTIFGQARYVGESFDQPLVLFH